ncbi:hypothetical protein ACFV6I_36755, partial [Kitasatospora sp. NPDC059803]
MTPRPARLGRRCGRRVLVPLLGAVLLLVAGAPAEAATGYRYWSFWRGTGDGWLYQQQGPGRARPPGRARGGGRVAVWAAGGPQSAPPPAAG